MVRGVWDADSGRSPVDDHDTLATTPVMVVNEAFVRRFLPRESPIGKSLAITVRMGGITRSYEDDRRRRRRRCLSGDPRAAPAQIYFPLAQRSGPLLFTNFFITVRASAGAPR